VSTAPWRIAKPKSLYQLPHFIAPEPTAVDIHDHGQPFEATERLARKLAIGRSQQDAWALKSHARAQQARDDRRFVGEILPLRGNAEEARDQSATDPSPDEVERVRPFSPPTGTVTSANTSSPHDGAAIVLVVSPKVWDELGRPPALKLVASAVAGVGGEQEAEAPVAAVQKLYGRLNGFDRSAIGTIELGESSAVQALALARALDVDPDVINPAGGSVVRGHPLGASGAVLVVRLFTDLVRVPRTGVSHGAVVQGAIGGLGLAALFERVGGG
jgi:acetyl-CoA C-acetyltransferase